MELTLSGGSMRPLLRPGQRASVKETRADGLSPGDIVLYRAADKLLLHRFAFRTARGLWIFDDAACVGWHRIDPQRVLGRLRHSSLFTRGFPGLLYGLLASIVFMTLRSLRRWIPNSPPR